MKEGKYNIKKSICSMLSLMLVIAASWGFVITISDKAVCLADTNDVPSANIHPVYVSEYDGTIEGKAQLSDYVFVGKVTGYCGTEYTDKASFTRTDGVKQEVSNIFTRYQVEVLKNLKNDLSIGDTIEIKKLGGMRQDLTGVEVVENDEMPVAGKTYVFLATKHGEELLVAGEYTNLEITEKEEMDQLDIHTLEEHILE